ncbi:MAG: TonB-dependent receptor [Gemmatimonadales bacterium]
MPPAIRHALLLFAVLPGSLVAQGADSARQLNELTVTVTRTPEALGRLGASVTVLDSAALRRGRVATGLDEALAFVPGLITGNRWNYSVDQRLTIRGFGARANFGVRGIKVILDGVPQTLPDGQSTLTNLDLGQITRVEVLRGAASALYGNASGGVLTFRSSIVPTAPWHLEARAEGGSFGSAKGQLTAAARLGNLGVTAAASRFTTDGFRQHSRAEQRRFSLGADWFASGSTTLSFRLASARDPRAENPGALTPNELSARRDSAAASNILRGADKRVSQSQGSIGIHHEHGRWQFEATTWTVGRDLDNPLATPPPAPVTSTSGTYVDIDRRVWGGRASATVDLGGPRLTTGLDLQSLRDDRTNQRAIAGVPTGVLFLDQRERVAEFGPFAQILWPVRRVVLRAGVRHDASRFQVDDAFLNDGDGSGRRTLASWSGNVGASMEWSRHLTAWTSVATTFETPTTTELANRPEGDGGFNPDLDPQRSVSEELGLRGDHRRLHFEAALYRTTTHDAIVPYREIGGRSYFRNAGATRTTGAEASGSLLLRPGLSLLGTWTWTHAIFTNYRVQDGANVDTLDGHRLAGLPEHVVRIGLRGSVGRGMTIDIDHAFSASQFADDENVLRVAGWAGGVTGARLAWHGIAAGRSFEPFLAITNAFDRHYVGSVTLNGTGGRVLEPAAGRAIYAGLTVGVSGKD